MLKFKALIIEHACISLSIEEITYPLSSISPKVILENGKPNSREPVIPSF